MILLNLEREPMLTALSLACTMWLPFAALAPWNIHGDANPYVAEPPPSTYYPPHGTVRMYSSITIFSNCPCPLGTEMPCGVDLYAVQMRGGDFAAYRRPRQATGPGANVPQAGSSPAGAAPPLNGPNSTP
jgi:hypothetical protein